MDGLINCTNTTHRELTISRYSSKKAWNLVSSLTKRISEDVYEPMIGVLKAFREKRNTSSTLVYYATFKSHTIMKEQRDL